MLVCRVVVGWLMDVRVRGDAGSGGGMFESVALPTNSSGDY